MMATAAVVVAAAADLQQQQQQQQQLLPQLAGSSGIGTPGLPLYTREQLARSPSLEAGLDPEAEARWRRQYVAFVHEVGMALGVPQWAIYSAVFLAHHFFAKRSMTSSDRFLVAAACLYLSCKLQEAPKYLRDVVRAAEHAKWRRFCRERPGEPRRWDDAAHLEQARERVLLAERAVLYAVGFELGFRTPYPRVLELLRHDRPALDDAPSEAERQARLRPYEALLHVAWTLVNYSLHTPLSLRYPPERIAGAAVYLAHELMRLPLPAPRGAPFVEVAGLVDHGELQDICGTLLDVFVNAAPHGQAAGSALAAATAAAAVAAAQAHAAQASPAGRGGGGAGAGAPPTSDQLAAAGATIKAQPLQQQQQQPQQQQQQQAPAAASSEPSGSWETVVPPLPPAPPPP